MASPPHCLPPGPHSLPQPPRRPSQSLTPLTALPKPHQLEDVGPRGAQPLLPRCLPSLQLHPHGVQQPLPVGNLMGPHDVEEGRAQRVQRLALVGDLRAEGSVKGGPSVSKWALNLQRQRGQGLRGRLQEAEFQQRLGILDPTRHHSLPTPKLGRPGDAPARVGRPQSSKGRVLRRHISPLPLSPSPS